MILAPDGHRLHIINDTQTRMNYVVVMHTNVQLSSLKQQQTSVEKQTDNKNPTAASASSLPYTLSDAYY